MPNFNKVFHQYPDLSENNISSPKRKMTAEVLRRVKALKVDWIKEVQFGSYDSNLKNVWEYIKNMPAILKDPVPKLQSQMAERIGDRDTHFFERESVDILKAVIDRLTPEQVLFLRSGDEFISEYEMPTGRPAFLVVPNGEGFITGEQWKASEGSKYEIKDSLTKKEIVRLLSQNLDSEYWKQQITIFEKPIKQSQSETVQSLSNIRKELVEAN
jgi:hypothetical protein